MALIEVKVPDIGDFKDVAVIEVFVKSGDTIKVEQSLITVESDKASMEIPSSHAGVLKELKVKLGDKINIGDLLAILDGVDAVSAPAAAAAAAASAQATPATPAAVPPVSANTTTNIAIAAASTPLSTSSSAVAGLAASAPRSAIDVPAHAPGGTTVGLPHASPSVRKFARELGVPLDEMKGTGNKGRISQEDVQAFTKSVMCNHRPNVWVQEC